MEARLLVLLLADLEAMPTESVDAPIGVMAIALSDGKTRWSLRLGKASLRNTMVLNAVATNGGQLWVALDGLVAAVEMATGSLKFSAPLAGVAADQGVWSFGDGRAYLQTKGLVLGLDQTGVRWRTPVVTSEDSQPVSLLLDGDGLIAEFVTSEQLEVARLTGKTGEVVWHQALEQDAFLYGMALGQERVVVGLDDELVALDTKTGAEAWTRALDDFDTLRTLVSRPGHGVVSGAEAVEAFSFVDGSTVWRKDGFHDVVAWRDDQAQRGMAAAAQVAMTGDSYYEIVGKRPQNSSCDNSGICHTAQNVYYRWNYEAEAKALAQWESTFGAVTSAVAIPKHTSDKRADSQYAKMNRLLDPDHFSFSPGGEVNAAVVNLDTGVVTEAGVPETFVACTSIVLIDSTTRTWQPPNRPVERNPIVRGDAAGSIRAGCASRVSWTFAGPKVKVH
ncbi:MAG: hypothetical protein CO108_16005 [Deltaproteobacteria bacterium CG_4_9_14_3_um_filter_63_12]|nr:MAG: hypothetical protein CO108_16005 [Deltaproteobacteria bacterium CG_4_9_14_3_um_filter_63_12]